MVNGKGNPERREKLQPEQECDAPKGHEADAIIEICPRHATRSGRVAQLAEQLTLNQ